MADRNKQRKSLFGRKAKRVGDFAMIQPITVRSARLRPLSDGVKKRNPLDNWAGQAYDAVKNVAEVGFVTNMKANLGSQCMLKQQQRVDGVWVDSDDKRVSRVMDAFVPPSGGQPDLLRRAFLHLDIAGDSTLTGTTNLLVDSEFGIHWEFLSASELPITNGGALKRRRDGGVGEDVAADTYVARMWRSDPEYSDLADSPMRRVLTICEEIMNLTQQINATTKSRLASGILYVPDEVTFATPSDPDEDEDEFEFPDEDGVDEDGEPIDPTDAFMNELEEHLKAPIKNRESLASLVPLLMRGPADMFNKIGLIEIARDLTEAPQRLRTEALGRLGAGLDIDPAVMQGKSSLNMWTAANVDTDLVDKHVRPVGDHIARFVTVAYLHVMLEEFEAMAPEEFSTFRLVFDPSPIISRSDEGQAARVLHELDALSDESLVLSNGFEQSDMPDDAELSKRLARRLLLSNPALGPALGELAGLPGIDWGARPGVGLPGAHSGPGGHGDQVEDGADAMVDDNLRADLPNSDPSMQVGSILNLLTKVSSASEMALDRAFERAAARVKNKARGDHEMKARIEGAGSQALAVLSPTDLKAISVDPDELLAGAWDPMADKVRRWTKIYLSGKGTRGMIADDIAALAASTVCAMLQDFAVQHIHMAPPPSADGMVVPQSLLITALTRAGVT